MNFRNKSLVRHLTFWVCFWLIQSLLFSGGKDLGFYMVKNVAIVSLQSIIVYLNWYFLFRLISSKQYLLFASVSLVLVYLVFSVSFTFIDIAFMLYFPEMVTINPYQFSWTTNFWAILSGSALYSLALLGSTIFLLIKSSTREVPELGSEPAPMENQNTLMLKEGKVIHRLNIEDILFVQGMKEYVSWHTKNKKLITLHSLASLESELEGKGFLRTHKSFIVNTKCVSAVRYDSLDIPGNKIPIGRSYRNKVQDCFQSEI